MTKMDIGPRRRIESNIFHASLPAIEDWTAFLWHLDNNKQCDTWKVHSSQALAIDVFGIIKMLPQCHRDAVLNALARRVGVPEGGPWALELEWVDKHNLLNETGKKTQVDAFACSPYAVILFEGKFTERDGGTCSQVDRRKDGQVQCNGNYVTQFNPVNQRESRCALSGKGIRYWEIVPTLFQFDSDSDYSPCPFAGSWYQWMRNLALGKVLSGDTRNAAFVVAFADGPRSPFVKHLAGADWKRFLAALRKDVRLDSMSYQSIISSAREKTGSTAVWDELNDWVDRKIKAVWGT
jgi:hypothetical protein